MFRVRHRHLPGLLASGLLAGGLAALAAPVQVLEPAPPVTWRHALAWTLSSDDVLFGRVVDLLQLADGSLAVADGQLGQVLVLERDGTVARILPVAGEGPGQVIRLTGLAETADGELVLVQAWPGRAEVVARDGTPRRSLRAQMTATGGDGAVATLLRLVAGRDRWLGLLVRVDHPDRRRSRTRVDLAWLDPDRLEIEAAAMHQEVVAEIRPGVVDETAGHAPHRGWTLLADGRALVAPARDAYRLELHHPERGLQHAFTRRVPTYPRPAREIEGLRRGFRRTVDGREVPVDLRYHETAEAVTGVQALGQRQVLVTSAHRFADLPPGVGIRLDLLDLAAPGAATVADVHLGIPLRPDRDELMVLPDRDVVVLRDLPGCLSLMGSWPGSGGSEEPPAIEYWSYQGEAP